jgi:hypothetical protein
VSQNTPARNLYNLDRFISGIDEQGVGVIYDLGEAVRDPVGAHRAAFA